MRHYFIQSGRTFVTSAVTACAENENRIHSKEVVDALASLKACAKQKDLVRGRRVHEEILKRGLDSNCFVASNLVSVYVKCDALAKAASVLFELPVRDVVCWNALIAGYVQQGQAEEALHCFEIMQKEDLSPNRVTYLCTLRACGILGAINKGEQIHDEIVRQGLLELDTVLGTSLVDMYAKCGALAKAARVHKELSVHDVVSWNALIAGYAEHDQGKEALRCFDQMKSDGFSPNAFTFACILKACGSLRAAENGAQIHDEIVNQGLLENDTVLGTALVDMYVKCGALTKAALVLDNLPLPDTVCLSALIAGYAQQEYADEALKCFKQMQCEGVPPTTITFINVLKACASIGAVAMGRQILDQVIKLGLLRKDSLLGNALLEMLVKCGAVKEALHLLDEFSARNVVSWNVIVTGYANEGQGENALKCIEWMQEEGFSPNRVTFISVLKACGVIGAVDKGEEIHKEIERQRLLGDDNVLGTALVDMYAKCGSLSRAAGVHNELCSRDAVSWSALIAGYAQQGQGERAWKCFKQMQDEGIYPSNVTFISILKACASIKAVNRGEEIYNEIVRRGLLGEDVVVDTAVIDMYCKCGALAKASQVFDELFVRNTVSWNALMAGFVQEGQGEQALKLFEKMQYEGLCPDTASFICVLKACGSVGAAGKGAQICGQIVREQVLGKDAMLCASIVDMYAKCGAVAKAADVLFKLPIRDVVSWNSVIAGFAEHGYSDEALKCFELMQQEGVSPDTITLASVLSACSRSGLLDEGEMFYINMKSKYGIVPDINHHTSMVDLFSRSGAFEKAVEMIKKVPPCDHLPVWRGLLSACQECGNVNLGRFAFDNVVLDKNDGACYALMIRMYVDAGMQEDAKHIQTMRM